ncbi:MAG: hypothetical protein D6698_03460 [Gammaproteobacteria bacterium]|nr:MAG: hypothetical protein D6698_03460 [Gammaproteobacteria bacterium]
MNDQFQQDFVRTYANKHYHHVAMVNHRGTVVAFAMDDSRKIFYTVLDVAHEDQSKGDLDVNYWSNDPQPVAFPREIEQVGYGSLSAVTMPTVKLDTRIEVEPHAVSKSEMDPFLSTTARLSADAPFQVVTDNQYIYLFRQAIASNHQDMVHKLETGDASAKPNGKYVTDSEGQKVPLVHGTLLVDRYVLTGTTLALPREVRFRRSRNRFRPASSKDSLGAKDMEGKPFYEPTKELDFVGSLQHGCFTVTLLPTIVADVERWQIFAYNATTKQIDGYNIERDDDGYFNTLGTQLYTSPDKKYQSSVLERNPGKCPFTGKALVPVDDPENDSKMQKTSFVLEGRTVSNGLAARLYYEQEDAGNDKHIKQHARLLLCAVTGGADPYTDEDRQRDFIAAVDFGVSHTGKLAEALSQTEIVAKRVEAKRIELKTLNSEISQLKSTIDAWEKEWERDVSNLSAIKEQHDNALTQLNELKKTPYARFYQDKNYKGHELAVPAGTEISDLDNIVMEKGILFDDKWGDRISSIKLDDGVWVEVFWKDNFEGETKSFYSSTTYVGDHWNDDIASLKVHETQERINKRKTAQQEYDRLLKQYNELVKTSNKLSEKRAELANKQAEQKRLQQELQQEEVELAKLKPSNSPNQETYYVPLPPLLINDLGGQTRDEVIGELIGLERELPSFQQQVKTLEQDVATKRANLARLNSGISQLKSTIDAWERDVSDLSAIKDQHDNALIQLKKLKKTPYARIYQDKDYGGHGLAVPAGTEISDLDNIVMEKGILSDDKWGDRISSIELDDGVWVEVFWKDNFKGETKSFYSSTTYVGDHWNDDIASLKVHETQTRINKRKTAQQEYERLEKQYNELVKTSNKLPEKRTELANKQAEQARIQQELQREEAELAKLRDLLRRKTARLAELRKMRFGTPPPMPMPHCHTDRQGLTVSSALLGFAYTDAQPALFESAIGRVKMYFKGVNQQFFAAYYDVRTARAKWSLSTSEGTLAVESMMASDHLNQTTITVADGSDADHCLVTISNPETGLTETWPDVPRKATIFAQALNGVANKQAGKAADSVSYNYAKATVNRAGFSLAQGSMHIIVDGSAAKGEVQNGTATLIREARSPRWTADAPGTALAFDGKVQYIGSEQHAKFVREGDLTLEAWINPATVAGEASVIHAHSGKDNYGLGLKEAALKSALTMSGTDDYVELPTLSSTALHGDFTLEAWVRLNTTDRDQSIIGNLKASRNKGLHFIVRGGKPYIGFYDNDLKASEPLKSKVWYHLACRYNARNRERVLFVNGEQVAKDTATESFQGTETLYIGRSFAGFLNGNIDEVRIWNVARSEGDIRANWHRQISGSEPGLVGYYNFADHDAHDRSDHGHHGILKGNLTTSPLADSPLNTYTCFAVVGEDAIVSKEVYTAGSWQHFAAVFDQSYALKFSGNDYGDAGNSPMLNITDDLTIEAFIRLESLGRKQGILSKGMMDSGAEGSVPYALYINEQGNLVFAFENEEGHNFVYPSKNRIEPGKPQHIAIVRKSGQQRNEKKGKKQITYKVPKEGAKPDDEGNVEMVEKTQTIETVESVSFDRYDDIYLYVGSHEPTHIHHTDGKPRGNNGQLFIGRSYISNTQKAQFHGIISEVRIWGRALEQDEFVRVLKGNEKGLTAWWRVEENGGNVAYDAKGENHARLTGTTWVKNPDPEASSFKLYRNGQVVKTRSMSRPAIGIDQFTLGARLRQGGDYDAFFNGDIEEVRIWKTVRRQEEVLDNVFTRLKGEKRDLIAYYTFDHLVLNGGTMQEEVKDVGLKSNHLAFPATKANRPTEVLSTAPISNDTAQVRSALAGIKNDFHKTISGRPAVTEYADMQRAPDGTPHGIHKRCYAYTRNGKWFLSTGYKVGNLVTEWIGQAQFDPQVVGYIEGAPPVPSENLTEGYKRTFKSFNGASQVTLVESDSVSYTISTSQEDGYTTSFEGEASMGAKGKLSIVTAPMGVGISEEMEFEAQSKLKLGMETSGAWSSGESYSAGQTVTRNSSAALGGSWDVPDQRQWVNPELTRRFIPANMGFAFVESETADIFALRLEHTGTLVAFRMLPNPDIPKDTNIIPFPLNNRYTKQGTLDGRIGFTSQDVVLDPDYKGAKGYGEYSYFKPKEAYALKKRIEREEQKLKAFYDNFDTLPAGAKMLKKLQPGIEQVAGTGIIGLLPGGVPILAGMTLAAGLGTTVASAIQYAAADKSLVKKYARRNLVNTYVWTADGGFFEESTQVSQVRSTSSSGSYTLSGNATGGFEGGVSGIVSFSLGLSGTINGSVNQINSKNEDAEESFRIDVQLSVPDDLQKYEYKTEGDTDSGVRRVYQGNNPVSHPGKVDAYRFMTFYLEPQSSNFEDLFGKVIDPIWLEQSNHPNAIALRQANQSNKKPKCWRVFHRVTFVSRILPDFPLPTAPPLEKKMVDLNIASNYELVRRLDPFVSKQTSDWVQFKDAVKNAVEAYLPELSNEEDLEVITQFLADYYGVIDTD